MSKEATPIRLSEEERGTLLKWIRSSITEQRLVFRAHIVLKAAQGSTTAEIASELQTRPGTVSKWRNRFYREGLTGLQDAPRSGKRPVYDDATERRILAKLDEPPPLGYAGWNGRLLAQALGNVSKHQVWRVLRRHGVHLQRRRSWCIGTEPEFAPKAADIVGLYLDPPENAVVLCVVEKPAIQALERAQGYVKLPNGQALLGFGHEHRRHGITTLFAALNVATGQVQAGHYRRRRRREFLHFMNEVVAEYPHQEIHVVVDHINTHKPKHDQWLARHKHVRFHYTPSHASWLHQIEIWFCILNRQALQSANFVSPQDLRNAIDRFIAVCHSQTTPFEWRKRHEYPGELKK